MVSMRKVLQIELLVTINVQIIVDHPRNNFNNRNFDNRNNRNVDYRNNRNNFQSNNRNLVPRIGGGQRTNALSPRYAHMQDFCPNHQRYGLETKICNKADCGFNKYLQEVIDRKHEQVNQLRLTEGDQTKEYCCSCSPTVPLSYTSWKMVRGKHLVILEILDIYWRMWFQECSVIDNDQYFEEITISKIDRDFKEGDLEIITIMTPSMLILMEMNVMIINMKMVKKDSWINSMVDLMKMIAIMMIMKRKKIIMNNLKIKFRTTTIMLPRN